MRKLLQFLEEFSWLLNTYSSVDFRSLPKLLEEQIGESAAQAAVGKHISSNPNKQFLVGALPRILTDSTLFPSNIDIANFADDVMGVQIPRHHKKSKYELIGHIVCETDELDEQGLSKLVGALAVIAEGGDQTKKLIKKRQEENLGWNFIIQELLLEER